MTPATELLWRALMGALNTRQNCASRRPMHSPAPNDCCSPKDRNCGELWGIKGTVSEYDLGHCAS